MATQFKSIQTKLTATETTIYTAPTGTTSIVFDGAFSNLTDATIGYINLKLYSGGNSAFQFYKIPLCYGSTQRPGKITLTAGSYLTAWTDTNTANNIDCTLCVLEQS